jgi:TonB family protein
LGVRGVLEIMNIHRVSILCGLAIAGQFAMAQQSAQHSGRIICTPPSGKLVTMVKPVFPPEAKSKGIFGLVVVEAEIDKTGTPTSVKLLSGDPVLAGAAMDAAKNGDGNHTSLMERPSR